jgi:multidrug efflux system membrane fusion protein
MSPSTNPKWSAALLVLMLAAVGCKQQAAPPRAAPPPVPVTVATAVERTVPVQLRAIGNVEAHSTVAIRAQVTGEITGVNFREGQDVSKGELLFIIDRRPFETALRQAEANLARDLARAENARVQAQRYAKLYEEGVTSREVFDQSRTEADALDALVRADRAAVEKARLDLQYCDIHSPMDGRTGSLAVHPGNVVKANDTVLVTINQISPIYSSFSVPQKYLEQVRRSAEGKLVVEAWPAGAANAETGNVTFVDNAVDETTGTIRLKATFSNAQYRLWPGQFVDVVLTLGEQPRAIVIPSSAIQTGQAGTYVFVVKQDSTVEMRPVVVTRTQGNDTILEKGVAGGEQVVTDGQLNLVPGVKVSIKSGERSP